MSHKIQKNLILGVSLFVGMTQVEATQCVQSPTNDLIGIATSDALCQLSQNLYPNGTIINNISVIDAQLVIVPQTYPIILQNDVNILKAALGVPQPIPAESIQADINALINTTIPNQTTVGNTTPNISLYAALTNADSRIAGTVASGNINNDITTVQNKIGTAPQSIYDGVVTVNTSIGGAGTVKANITDVQNILGGFSPLLTAATNIKNIIDGTTDITTGVGVVKTKLGVGGLSNLVSDISTINNIIGGMTGDIYPDLVTILNIINNNVTWKSLNGNVNYISITPAINDMNTYIITATSLLAPPALIPGSATTFTVQATTNNLITDANTLINGASGTSTLGVATATVAQAVGIVDVKLAPWGGIAPSIGVTYGAQAATGNLANDATTLINGGAGKTTVGDGSATSIAEALGKSDNLIRGTSATGNINNDLNAVNASIGLGADIASSVNIVKGIMGGASSTLQGQAIVINNSVGGADITSGLNTVKTNLGIGGPSTIIADVSALHGKLLPSSPTVNLNADIQALDLKLLKSLLVTGVLENDINTVNGTLGIPGSGSLDLNSCVGQLMNTSIVNQTTIGDSTATTLYQAMTNLDVKIADAANTSRTGNLNTDLINVINGTGYVPNTAINKVTIGNGSSTVSLSYALNQLDTLIDDGNKTGNLTNDVNFLKNGLGFTPTKVTVGDPNPSTSSLAEAVQNLDTYLRDGNSTGNLINDVNFLKNGVGFTTTNVTVGDATATASTTLALALQNLDTKIADGSATGNLINDVATVKNKLNSSTTSLLGDVNIFIGNAGTALKPCIGGGQSNINDALAVLDINLLNGSTFPIYQNGSSGALATATGQNPNTIPAQSGNLTTDEAVIKTYVGTGNTAPLGQDLAGILNRINQNPNWRGGSPNAGGGWTNVWNAINYLVTNNKVIA